MKVELQRKDVKDVKTEILVVGLFEGEKKLEGETAEADSCLGGAIGASVRKKEISGKFGESLLFQGGGGLLCERLLVVGLGKKDELTADRIRQIALTPVKEAVRLKKKQIATVLLGAFSGGVGGYLAARFLSLGFFLSNYSYDLYRGEKSHKIRSVTIIDTMGSRKMDVRKGIRDAEGLASGVNFARNLVNTPPIHLRPSQFARNAKKLAGKDISVKVFNEKEIKKMKMEGLVNVGMGSSSPPRLIVARYMKGRKGEKPIAIVGKGVTFDTGGISLKKWEGMDRMKYDMAGAAAALGVMKALPSLGIKRNVVAVVPVAENMPSGNAYRPGDVITMMSGKSVEVLSTDAEGRLILGDAIHYAITKEKASKVIDLATLTGACVVALGSLAMGMMGNDSAFLSELKRASEKSGERAWQLPLYEEYGEQIRSSVADIKNIGGAEAGTITAGFFLKHFVGATPWVHFDIAGVAWMEKEKMGYLPGATGAGVRLLVEHLMPGRKGDNG